jgi:hypothetical protein
LQKKMKAINHQPLINGIVHAGFNGFQRFVARNKSRCKLVGNRFVLPHDTMPSTGMHLGLLPTVWRYVFVADFGVGYCQTVMKLEASHSR